MRVVLKIGSVLYGRRRRIATGGVALLACLVGYSAVFGANGMLVYQRKKAEYRTLQQRLEAAQKDNDRLAQENRALRSDPAAIEREARQQLHYTKPGEVVFVAPAASFGAPRSQQPATAQK